MVETKIVGWLDPETGSIMSIAVYEILSEMVHYPDLYKYTTAVIATPRIEVISAWPFTKIKTGA